MSVDPWNSNSSDSAIPCDATSPLQFEDNFEPVDPVVNNNNISQQPQEGRLPDSDSYLAALERKLNKLKTNPSILQQLSERREACMQHLLNDGLVNFSPDSDLELNEPVLNNELLRFIRPEQALSSGELFHLVKYDHLEQDPVEQGHDSGKEGEESGTESSTSR